MARIALATAAGFAGLLLIIFVVALWPATVEGRNELATAFAIGWLGVALGGGLIRRVFREGRGGLEVGGLP